MAAMALMYNTKRNMQRRLEVANWPEVWAVCRRRGDGVYRGSSHFFSNGVLGVWAAFGSRASTSSL